MIFGALKREGRPGVSGSWSFTGELLIMLTNRPRRAKLKGLPPALHRQQALSAA